jgi:predicted amidohydrolase
LAKNDYLDDDTVSGKSRIAIAQTAITQDFQENVATAIRFVERCTSDVLLFPEGMISGYYPENPNYLHELDVAEIEQGLGELSKKIREKQIEVIIGTAIKQNDKWYNTAFWFNKRGHSKYIYRKCNLSNLDRLHFSFGSELETTKIDGIDAGIQLCREIKYPEPWLYLKLQGAKIVFHLNNNQSGFDNWVALYQTRAFENQMFVVSVNVSHDGQKLFSYVINPKGEIILQTGDQGLYTTAIDFSEVSDDFISQRRSDLIDTVFVHNHQ